MYNFLFVLGSSGEQVSKACCHAQCVSARRPDYSSWIVLCFDTKKKVTGIPCMHPIYILSHVFNWKAVVRGGVCVWGGSFHSIFERQQISWINTESEYQSQSQFKENFFSSFSASIFKQVLKPLLQASRCYFPSPQRAGVQPESCLKSIQTQLLLVAQLIRYQLTIKRKDFEVGYGNHKLDRMSMMWS